VKHIDPDRRLLTIGLLALPLAGCNDAAAPQPKAPTQPQVPPEPKSGLTELVRLDPTIRLDIRYATPNNVTGKVLYAQPRAFLVRPAADALVRVHQALAAQGYGLTIFDAYRPWRVTKALWDATPPGPKRNYVANPKRGSKHNRGCAIDLTLHELQSGQQLAMPSGYDEFTKRAHRDFADAPAEAIANRSMLETAMQQQGFRGASNEWWHFDFVGWANYPILDVPFEDIDV
jgi:zinc D-Ala-D-Ala dipeptidase